MDRPAEWTRLWCIYGQHEVMVYIWSTLFMVQATGAVDLDTEVISWILRP